LLILVGIVVLIALMRAAKSPPSDAPQPSTIVPFEIEVSTSFSKPEPPPDCGSVTQAKSGGWIINPASGLPLTLSGVDEPTARRIKEILDGWDTNPDRDSLQQVVEIVARTNLVCDEIAEYRRKYRRLYLRKLEALQGTHPEWQEASTLDREDILVDLRKQARASLECLVGSDPSDDLTSDVLEPESLESTTDDVLWAHFDFKLAEVLIRFGIDAERIHVIPADHYRRREFDRLVEMGLARRGTELPVEAMLGTLMLKDMNELVRDPALKKFSRKAKAVEYLATQPWIGEAIRERVKTRELFQIHRLPDELRGMNVPAVADALKLAEAVGRLIAFTYVDGRRELANRKGYPRDDREGIIGWEISIEGDAPPFCKKFAERAKRTKSCPRLPAHLGCKCWASPIYSYG
jgi:hypothetical protein